MSRSVDASKYLIPTLKDDPADAEAISHRLLVRAGFVRQVGSGLYTYLPLGWRVLQNTMGIIREEMDTIGLEMLMPVLQPAELWQTTDRYDVDVLFKLEDSSGKPYVLAITHEECVTMHAAREIRSYRELPQIWYHQQTKERDEPRPRGGILRTREFIMKDSYSFDRDLDGLEESYAKHRDVYVRIFDRCGLETYAVEADVGMMGGHGGEEFVAPSPNGEADLVRCSNCDYAANLEVARSRPRRPEFPPALGAPEEVETPGATTIEGLAEMLGDRPGGDGEGDADRRRRRDGPRARARRRPAARDEDGAGAREDRTGRPPPMRSATAFGADPGSIGPVGTKVRVIADESLREGQYVGGANRTGWHLRGVEAGRDYRGRVPRPARGLRRRHVRGVRRGDAHHRAGDRGWPHLQAGDALLRAARRHLPRRGGKGAPHRHGLLRHRPGPDRRRRPSSRTTTRRASIWPASLAPFHVHMVVIGDEPTSRSSAIAREIQAELERAGLTVLFDDRSSGPGAKFADAELIGCPVRVTVGKRTATDGSADVQVRRGRDQRPVPVADVAAAVHAALSEA